MKKLLALSICCLVVLFSCTKATDENIPSIETRSTMGTENLMRNPNRSVPSCDDLIITHALIYQDVNCCNYSFDLNLDESYEGDAIEATVKINGNFYDTYSVDSKTTFYLSLCPDPGILVEIYIGEDLCYSRMLTCKCTGCEGLEITTDLVQENGNCCLYSINFLPVCDLLGGSILLDYYIDGTLTQNLNISNATSISIEICDDEKKEIAIHNGRGLCFSETLECVSCCDNLDYEVNGRHLGDGCCEFTFEVIDPDNCLGNTNLAFGWNPNVGLGGIEEYEFIGTHMIRVVKCLPEQYVNFVVFDDNQNVCYRSSNYQYCQD